MMKDDTYDAKRAHLDHEARARRPYAHGDFFRDAIQRPPDRLRFRLWFKTLFPHPSRCR